MNNRARLLARAIEAQRKKALKARSIFSTIALNGKYHGMLNNACMRNKAQYLNSRSKNPRCSFLSKRKKGVIL
jgi:Fe-S-cluster containining protein